MGREKERIRSMGAVLGSKRKCAAMKSEKQKRNPVQKKDKGREMLKPVNSGSSSLFFSFAERSEAEYSATNLEIAV